MKRLWAWLKAQIVQPAPTIHTTVTERQLEALFDHLDKAVKAHLDSSPLERKDSRYMTIDAVLEEAGYPKEQR